MFFYCPKSMMSTFHSSYPLITRLLLIYHIVVNFCWDPLSIHLLNTFVCFFLLGPILFGVLLTLLAPCGTKKKDACVLGQGQGSFLAPGNPTCFTMRVQPLQLFPQLSRWRKRDGKITFPNEIPPFVLRSLKRKSKSPESAL